ncbi:MAG: DUF1330 domain-containing protein [Actinomycetota bacterium]|uniref:DUF1330 domain-containing protein n=1 Tax=uncultured Ilumatobacter sp. TaxID=879968 RepID=UPI00374E25F1|nr:DUF1330 domain-containing protein [Actinomycetota bacterium]
MGLTGDQRCRATCVRRQLHSENDPNPVAVVIEFPDADAAMAGKTSDAYQAMLPGR